jgi:hypothetical protein
MYINLLIVGLKMAGNLLYQQIYITFTNIPFKISLYYFQHLFSDLLSATAAIITFT